MRDDSAWAGLAGSRRPYGLCEAAKLGKLPEQRDWRLDRDGNRFRLIDEDTGTMVAADWDEPVCYGLTIAQASMALGN